MQPKSILALVVVVFVAAGCGLLPGVGGARDRLSAGSTPAQSVAGSTGSTGSSRALANSDPIPPATSVVASWQAPEQPDPGRIVLAQGDVEGWEEVTASRAEELGEEAAIRQSSFERVFRRRASQSRDPDELVVRAKVYDPAVDLQPWGRTQPLGARPVPLPGALADEAIAWWIPGEPASLGIAHLRVANAYIGLRLSTRNADGALPDALVQGWAATLAQRARAALSDSQKVI